MMSDENEISLIMKSDHPSSRKLWSLRNQSCQHSSHSMTQSSIEIVQNNFWVMICRYTVVVNLRIQLERCELEISRRAIRQMHQYYSVGFLCFLCQDNKISEPLVTGIICHIFQGIIPSLIIEYIWNGHFKILHEIEKATIWSTTGSHHDLRCSFLLEIISEFVMFILILNLGIITFNHSGVKLSGVFQSFWLFDGHCFFTQFFAILLFFHSSHDSQFTTTEFSLLKHVHTTNTIFDVMQIAGGLFRRFQSFELVLTVLELLRRLRLSFRRSHDVQRKSLFYFDV
mmetsp:Transcript_36/g.39  ORF Transcript_36/g.39 Transcript_36/m.39 type:complete len:285 (-) Transcript_36:36-890(-)